MKWVLEKLEIGDHIRVKRPYYYHHGVYVGDGMVIHFTGEQNDSISEPEKVLVRKTTIEFFANGTIVEKAKLSFLEKRHAKNRKIVVEEAEKAVGEGNYDFLHNNCEDFANKVCYNKKLSSQIDDIKDKM